MEEVERKGEGDGEGKSDDLEEVDDKTIQAKVPRPSRRPAQSEDKLRESLYELREMNEVFEGFLGALEAAKGHNEVCFFINFLEPLCSTLLLLSSFFPFFDQAFGMVAFSYTFLSWHVDEDLADGMRLATFRTSTADFSSFGSVYRPPWSDGTYSTSDTQSELDRSI